MLTEKQITYFHTFGFLVIRQAFEKNEVNELIKQVDDAFLKKQPPQDKDSFWVGDFIEDNPGFIKLVEDDRIYLVMKDLLGHNFIWRGAEGMGGIDHNLVNHSWHFDGHKGSQSLDYLRTKVMLYLDPQQKSTGALRVIPGSHRDPFHEALMPLQEAHLKEESNCFGVTGRLIPGKPIETEPGDVVIFNQWLYHGAFDKLGKRRVIVLKFGPHPEKEEHFSTLLDGAPNLFDVNQSFRRSSSPRVQKLVDAIDTLKGIL